MTVRYRIVQLGSSATFSRVRRHGLLSAGALALAFLTPRLLALKEGNVVLGSYGAVMPMAGIIIGRWSALWLALIPPWITMRTLAEGLPSPETATGDFGAVEPIMVLAVTVPLILGTVGIVGGVFARRGVLRLAARSYL